MQQGIGWKLARRLRPDLEGMDPRIQLFTYASLVMLYISTLPALFALGWLVAVTDTPVIGDHLPLFGVLLLVLTVMLRHPFVFYIELETGDLIPTTTSLTDLVTVSAAFVFGPTALWLVVVSRIADLLRTLFQARNRNPINARWDAITALSQDLSGDILGVLVGLTVYEQIGGDYPLAGLAAEDWLPALAARAVIMVAALVVPLILVRQINTVLRDISPPQPLWAWAGSVLMLVIPIAPFSIFGALVYSEAGEGLFLVFVAGVFLINYLAHSLSRTVERSQQRTRELAALERLGEAIIEAPPDLSTLEPLLRDNLNRMFPQDRIDILVRPMPDALPPLPVLTLNNSPVPGPLDPTLWDALWAADAPHLTRSDVRLSISGATATALGVKITADAPGEEGGHKELLIGGVYLLRARQRGKPASSLSALQALASLIGSAYYRALVHLESVEAEKMARELALAGQIQAKFLPAAIPDLPGYTIRASLIPARQTSGDFFDLIELPGGKLGLIVADVADKGTGAALYMALSRTLIRTFALEHPDDPGEALRRANARILSDSQTDQFVTVFYGVLEPASGTMVYANAGHNPALLLTSEDSRIAWLKRTGTPLGMFEDLEWRNAELVLRPGDLLLAYTDGVSEAQDSQQAEFGEDRLLAAAQSTGSASQMPTASAAHDAVLAAVTEFVGEAPQFDDITLLTIRRD